MFGGGVERICLEPEVIPDSSMLADINDVNNCLLWFVENSEHIKAVIQPDSMEKNKFLQLILSQNTHCCIEQIITLDSDYSKDNINDIRALEQLFPVVFYSENYNVYHCWRNIKKDNYTYMDMMLSEAGLLVFDDSLSKVFYTCESSYLEYYEEIFKNKKSNSGAFISSGDAAKEYDNEIIRLPGCKNRNVYVEEPGLVRLFNSIQNRMRQMEENEVCQSFQSV